MNRGIALRLSLLILSGITVIFSIVFSYNYLVSRQIIRENVERNAESLTLSTVNKIDSVLRAVERVPVTLAAVLEGRNPGRTEVIELLRAVIENNPDIYGAAVAFEPYVHREDVRAFAPYFFRREGKLEFTEIPYEYFLWDWYQVPREIDAPVWTEPYFDEGAGGIMMATFSVPFYRNSGGERAVAGIVTADISLSRLREIVSSVHISETGYGFLLSKNGTFVTHPDPELVMNETLFTVAEAKGDQGMRELGRRMIRGDSGFAPFTSLFTGKQCWMQYAPLPTSGWSLGVLFPQDELMEDITRLNRRVISIGLLGFFFLLLVIVWIARSITYPLRSLSEAAERIARGDLELELPVLKNRDEVGRLNESFRHMKTSLKRYIADLKETTAAKERIESELKIARDIQMGILPKTFPPFPHRGEFEIYGAIDPAREVGGDLYDFFFLDERHLCFVIGDVSGKGVPAALFMAITRTLIKSKATQGLDPGSVLARVNEDLCIDNEAMMFVTLFLGILDTQTGEVHYGNAGHNPPCLLRRNGEVEMVPGTGGTALGVLEDCVYRSNNIRLLPGDTLFLYTDGVTEAIDRDEKFFSEGRLLEELSAAKGDPPKEMVEKILSKVEDFSRGVEQSDDITLLAIRFQG